MMNRTQSYKILSEHFENIRKLSLLDLFTAQKNRVEAFNLSYDGLYFDFSKNNITNETLDLLINLAKEQGLEAQIEAMFSGEKINNTENRAVLHTALRADVTHGVMVDDKDVMSDIRHVLLQIQQFSNKLHSGGHLGYTGKPITDIVNIGIGGSDLGPVLASQALKPYRQSSQSIHFISSVDGYQIYDTLAELNPETTLFIIASKTFGTEETMTNAATARSWFLKSAKNTKHIQQHFLAVSTNAKAVAEFGIDCKNMFQFWDFVGGRYSVCSAIGLSVALYIGYDNFRLLLDGARAMDEHFYSHKHDLRHNLPAILALIGIWNHNFFNYTTQIISPYNIQLKHFPAYVQQLEMESNGKSVNKNGDKITGYHTCPVIWGDSGINGQHAYYQLLHQGTAISPMDIIIALSCDFSDKSDESYDDILAHNDILVANAFAQAEAFMCGKTYEMAYEELVKSGITEDRATFLAKHKVFGGNRPTNMLTLPEISPYYLGMLIALYEHKTFVQGVIWDVNSFDQMGVELGKQLANTILADIHKVFLASDSLSIQNTNDEHDLVEHSLIGHDSSTNSLIQQYINNRST
jgi:glucose-6-phosphate isomerase